MSVQTSYGFATPRGVAGGLFDIAPYAIDSRLNAEEQAGALKFGMGVVQGGSPGSDIRIPKGTDEIEVFEGVVLNGFTTQQNMAGDTVILPLQTVGVLRYGRAWVRVAEGVSPSYGDTLHLILSGNNAGLFTNANGTDNLTIKGRFIGKKGTGNIAPIELYNQLQEVQTDSGIGG